MIKGRNIDKDTFTVCSHEPMDLSGASDSKFLLLNYNKPIKINQISILYQEASSADAGVALNFGNFTSATTYGTTTTEASKALGYVKTIEGTSLTTDIVAAGTPFIVASAGGKVGTGTVIVSVTYTVMN